MFRKSLKAAMCVVAAGTALAACGPVKTGAAAVVGRDRITVSTLDSAVDRWGKELPKHPEAQQIVAAAQQQQPQQQQIPFDPSSHQRSALFQLIQIHLTDQLARELHVSVSAGQVDAFIAANGGRPSLDAYVLAEGLPTSYGEEFARSLLLRQALTQRQAAPTRRIKIEINPRFGTFNAEKGLFEPVCPQLSSPDSGTPDSASSGVKCL